MNRTSKQHKQSGGTLRPDRLKTSLVPALTRLPKAPALTGEALTAWETFGRTAMKLGTLSAYDLGALELLARCWGSCAELETVLRRDGLIVESGTARKAHPALQALAQARGLAHKLLADFGLSPPGRERISIDPAAGNRRAKPWDDAERYFK